MPKPVDDLVETLLSDPDFYPEKSEKEQKAVAYAIAWSQYNKKKKKKKSNKKNKKANTLNKLNKIIVSLEDSGFIKEAKILDSIFIRLAKK